MINPIAMMATAGSIAPASAKLEIVIHESIDSLIMGSRRPSVCFEVRI